MAKKSSGMGTASLSEEKVRGLPGCGERPTRLDVVVGASAVFVLVLGSVALLGWSIGIGVLTRLYASGSAMQPLTAVCAMLAGLAVAGSVRWTGHCIPDRPLAALVLALAAQTLAQHWTGADFGTDHLLFAASVAAQGGSYVHPGRMAEPTAAAFALIAVALLLIRSADRASGLIHSACATSVLLLVTVALLSHLYAIAPLSGVLGFTQVSIPTALALGGLSVGVLAARPGGGWVSLLVGRSVGASAARWLLPVVILIPVGVAALALRGSRLGLYPGDFRMVFTTAVTVILLAALALWGTRQLDTLVAERRSAEKVRENEATLRAFFHTEGLLASIMERRGSDMRYLTANAALEELFGGDDLAGKNISDVDPASADPGLLERLRAMEAGGPPSNVERSIETATGTRWFAVTISPIAGSPPEAPRFAMAAVDITDRKRGEAHQRLLLDELNHRVKNTLAVVQSLAQQSFRGDQATPAARRAFEARLAAVASAHNLLVRQDWTSASLRVLAAEVAGPGCGADRARIDLDGPDILLPPPTAVSLALAFHELCTNAVKYGSLSNDEGRVTLRWTVAPGDPKRLCITWSEHGGPLVTLPEARGFGSRLIERALSMELGGPVQMRFLPHGLICTIEAPLG